jgi:hypothetical protein
MTEGDRIAVGVMLLCLGLAVLALGFAAFAR